jgi:hypothetical protein
MRANLPANAIRLNDTQRKSMSQRDSLCHLIKDNRVNRKNFNLIGMLKSIHSEFRKL